MYFINDRVKHSITTGVEQRLERFDLTYQIRGSYFTANPNFQELIYIVMDKAVRAADRKIKVKLLATPGVKLASKLRNVRNASTNLDLYLDPRIQLRFDL